MKNNTYAYRLILQESQKELDNAIRNIELMRAQDHAVDIIRIVEKYYSNLDEQPEIAIKRLSCELIEYLKLIKATYYEGRCLTNAEWQFICDYILTKDVNANKELKIEAEKRIKSFIDRKYRLRINGPFEGVINSLNETKCEIAKIIKEYENSREEKRQKHYKNILEKEKTNISNNLISVFDINKRVIYSIQHNIMKYDIENEKNESKMQKKLAYLLRWKKYICDFQQITIFSQSYFIEDDKILCNEIKNIIHQSKDETKSTVLLVDCLLFEPYSDIQTEENKNKHTLKISSDYIKEVLCTKYHLFDMDKLKLAQSKIKANIKRMDNTREKIVLATASSLMLTLATGGLANAFAPAIAVALVGGSFSGLSGAALTSASLALMGGGSIVAGGFGMAGGTLAITSGGAIIGALSGASTTTLASILVDGVGMKSCVKLITICDILLTYYSYDNSKSVYSIMSICSEYISSSKDYLELVKNELKDSESASDNGDKIEKVKIKQQINELKKIKNNIEKNIKYYEKARKLIHEDREKAEKQINKKQNKKKFIKTK